MEYFALTDDDRQLIEVAQETLRETYVPGRHTCASAVRCGGGKVFKGISIQTSGYGTCAEPIALGAAWTASVRKADTIVTVARRMNDYMVVPPCGNCRQLLLDYVPDIKIILDVNGEMQKVSAREMLPGISLIEDNY